MRIDYESVIPVVQHLFSISDAPYITVLITLLEGYDIGAPGKEH